ncbi:hypothetical protein M5U04_02445 [Xenorhabdus sp. XENO-1]|uniref:hypothetical protein n=1 Tax=Xenorhabdus bovienii TaxID=40576 RepID=UPI0020CA4AA0|nr:hypothetical protein [Xenorhabdus bovienii]MCP9266988.1 hypothetical protein [Xenorhabdus bovienii subsp. africana]
MPSWQPATALLAVNSSLLVGGQRVIPVKLPLTCFVLELDFPWVERVTVMAIPVDLLRGVQAI